jgi:hypothetical protein
VNFARDLSVERAARRADNTPLERVRALTDHVEAVLREGAGS